MLTRALAFVGALALLAGPALATDSSPGGNAASGEPIVLQMSVPNLVPFQGLLTDNGGNPISGAVSLDLAIYDAAAGGTLLWSETQPAIAVADGLFDVQLGAATSLPMTLFDGEPRWLGISVDGEAELPRTQLLSTPHSYISNRAFGAPDQPLGFAEFVTSTSDVRIRSFYIGDDGQTGTQDWSMISGRLIVSFGGTVGTTQSGEGVITVVQNSTTVGSFDITEGFRPWAVEVPLTLNDGDAIDVFARADNASMPFRIRDIQIDTDSGGSSGGNTLDQAYDEGGPGAGRLIRTDAGPVEIIGVAGLRIGGAVDDGQLVMDYNGVTGLEVIDFSGFGQTLRMNDESGFSNFRVEPDVDGAGGFLHVVGSGGSSMYVDGNRLGTGDPELGLIGTSTIRLDSSTTGNASVILPTSSVSATEILNEAGISQDKLNNLSLQAAGSEMEDTAVTTITIPTSGYITLFASAQARLGTGNTITYQIDETAGGGLDNDYYHFAGGAWTTSTTYIPVATQRTYFKTAGTYTFRFEAQQFGGSGGGMWNSTLTAIFTPTSYGTVEEIVDPSDAGEFSAVSSVIAGDNGIGVESSGGVQVDLRELEMQVLRAQEALAAARAQDALVQLEAQRQAANR